MFRLNRNFEYALIALKHIACKADAKISTAREISLQYGLSFNLMARILLILKNADILVSIQGTKGGYALNTDLNNLTFLDFLQIISGQPLSLTVCLSDNKQEKKQCQIQPARCNILNSIKYIQAKIDNLAKKTTLNDIIYKTYDNSGG